MKLTFTPEAWEEYLYWQGVDRKATATEYYRYADDVLGMESFGASAPADLLFEKFGFTQEGIMKRACKLMGVEYKEVELGECKL